MSDKPSESKERGTKAEFDEAFAPIALQIGQFARAWNDLHEELATIFAAIVSAPSDSIIATAIWHSTANDRAQREMLRAANRAWIIRSREKGKSHGPAIAWLLNESDKLSDKRNDALHAPLEVLMNTSTFEFSVKPNYFYGNPRAIKLRDKDIQAEFTKYRDQTEKLREYAIHIWVTLRSGGPLPQTPILSTSPAIKNLKKQTRPAPKP